MPHAQQCTVLIGLHRLKRRTKMQMWLNMDQEGDLGGLGEVYAYGQNTIYKILRG